MPSPFPGMDPYLEHPEVWPGVHLLLIASLAEALTPQLRPKYVVSVEVRLYETSGEQSLLVGIPDVTVHRSGRSIDSNQAIATAIPPFQPVRVRLPVPEIVQQGFLEVREVTTKEVVTVIELLSPVNKRPGKGRQIYERKREQVLRSHSHLVEIDLLRAWESMPILVGQINSDYRILVSRTEMRPEADLYAFNVPDPIPLFSLPLRPEDAEPTIDIHQQLNEVYDRAGYDLKIDYSTDPVPPLSEPDALWAKEIPGLV